MRATNWQQLSIDNRSGELGSEGGVIISDEIYNNQARITLERSARLAAFAITCGLSGWLVHTRFFESEAEAGTQLDAMKAALTRLADAVKPAVAMTPDGVALLARLCQEFVEQFP
jgi:hypothetical protein